MRKPGREEQLIQARSDRARDEQHEKVWRTQCLPRFANAGLTPQQIEVAKATFCAGFYAGWEHHQAFLMKEFIRDNQENKVYLA